MKYLLLTLLCTLIAVNSTFAISMRHDLGAGNDQSQYLAEGAKWDAVGFMHWTEPPPASPPGAMGQSFVGTGTLVTLPSDKSSCSAGTMYDYAILTAAHNIDGNHDGTIDVDGSLTIYFGDDTGPNGTLAPISASIPVSQMSVHPGWSTSGGAAESDFAILTFNSSQVSGMGSLPTPMSATGTAPSVGSTGTMVGYGLWGWGNNFAPNSNPPNPDGKRRGGQNILDIVNTDPTDNAANTGLTIQSDFDGPGSTGQSTGATTQLTLEALTGSGDSGGPIIVNNQIVGVLNGGFIPPSVTGADPSEYGDRSVWASISATPANHSYVGACVALTAIPEPSSCLLIGLVAGVLGLGKAVARRRS